MKQVVSFYEDLQYEEQNKPAIRVMVKTDTAKEIRLLFRKGQEMKEHKAPFPIIIQVLEGEIDFGAENERTLLKKGMMIVLDSHIPHDLVAEQDSIVRLSLNLQDTAERVASI